MSSESQILRESSPSHPSNQYTTLLHHYIQNLTTTDPIKQNWLNLFNSFRILRSIYSNHSTTATGLRLLAWSNLFNTLHLSPPSNQPPIALINQTPTGNENGNEKEIFSTQNLAKYASDILQVLILEAYDLLNLNGCDEGELDVVRGAKGEIERDFWGMLGVEGKGDDVGMGDGVGMGLRAGGFDLVSGMEGLGLEFGDEVLEVGAWIGEMNLD